MDIGFSDKVSDRNFTMVYFSLCSSTFYHSSCTRPEKFYTREHMFTEIPSPLFFFFSSFTDPRYVVRAELIGIFSNWPRCVYLTGTHVCWISSASFTVVHGRRLFPALDHVFIDAVFCLFSMHIYTRKYSNSRNSKCCKP